MKTSIIIVGVVIIMMITCGCDTTNLQKFNQSNAKCNEELGGSLSENLADKTRCTVIKDSQNHLVPKEWTLENMPLLPIIFAKSGYLPEGPCKKDSQKFLHDLLNGSTWAIQMFDSSTKYPEGILSGHTRHLGNFEQCYNLHVNILEENAQKIIITHEISGRYCLVDIEYKNKHAPPIRQKLPVSKNQIKYFDMNKSFWKFIEQLEDPIRVRRNRLQLALCVPATCDAQDIETALRIPLEKLGASKDIELQTTVQPIFCKTAKEAPKFTLGAGIYCAVFLALISLVIISTWYDKLSNENASHSSVVRNIMLHFSAQRNYAKITHVYYTNTGLDSIHYIRFFAIVVSVYIHNMCQYVYEPVINAVYVEETLKIPFATLILNANTFINIFFATSGVLLGFYLLKHLEQYRELSFVKSVASRYLRSTPLYATIIGFYIWIYPLLGYGPFWHIVTKECTHCAKNWWMNLLYINTYLAPSELCVVHGWYLAADFLLFVCSHFVIYAFWCMPRKLGYPFLGMLTLISCTMSFVTTYVYGASPVLRFTRTEKEIPNIPEFEMYYIKGHMCATGYLVGIIAGAILHDHKDSAWRLSKFWSHILVIPVPVILYVLIHYWAHKFHLSYETHLLEKAIFAFFQRLIPALCVCSTIVLLSVGSQLEFYYNFFTPHWIQPLSNLCYGVYMLNLVLVTIDGEQTRTAKTFGILKSIWDTIPLLLVSFLLSLLLAMCIEMPFRNVAKWLFQGDKKLDVKENDIMKNKRISEDKVMKKE